MTHPGRQIPPTKCKDFILALLEAMELVIQGAVIHSSAHQREGSSVNQWGKKSGSVSCSVLSDSFTTPWTVARQAPLSMGFSRQEYWSGLPFPSPGDLSNSGIKPRSPALQVDSSPSVPGKPKLIELQNTQLACKSLSYGPSDWPP